jgi:hypothetical protein
VDGPAGLGVHDRHAQVGVGAVGLAQPGVVSGVGDQLPQGAVVPLA